MEDARYTIFTYCLLQVYAVFLQKMSLYHTNQGIREAIDRILKRNASRQANQGTDTTDDQRYRDAKLWSSDLMEIGRLDPEFWAVINEQED